MEDTSQHGAFAKDQVYLDGAMRILAVRHDVDFRLFYAGQVSLDDLPRIAEMADFSATHIPDFLKDLSMYRQNLEDMIMQNGLELVLSQRVPSSRGTSMPLSGLSGDALEDLGACDECSGACIEDEDDDTGQLTEDDGGTI